MSGGFFQLLSYGCEDTYLMSKPNSTFFAHTYGRSCNFISAPVSSVQKFSEESVFRTIADFNVRFYGRQYSLEEMQLRRNFLNLDIVLERKLILMKMNCFKKTIMGSSLPWLVHRTIENSLNIG